jgi:GAF domain-containing protein
MSNRTIQEIRSQLDQLEVALPDLDAQGAILTNLKRLIERLEPETELLRQNEEGAVLNRINLSITSTFDLASILQTVVREMAQHFQIQRCGIALFNSEKTGLVIIADYPISETDPTSTGAIIPIADNPSTLHVLETGQSIVVPQAQTNPLTAPVHEIMRWHNTQCLMIVPLRVRGEIIGTLGLATIEPERQFTPAEVRSAETIAGQVAGTIANARLLEETQRRSERLQAAAEISRAASSILDVDELINTSVNLIRDRFNFDYIGLFLVDEAKEWAVLQAGTGEAGRIQLERKHQLKIGGTSMIGWSIANRKARIAPDVGEEAVFFRNPVLPETRSEMALPLISREEVIGALTVQSVKRGAFSDEDVTLLQTMADQLANAIANARLFETVAQAQREAESRLRETQALQQLSQELAGTLDIDEIFKIFFRACTEEIGLEYVMVALVDKAQHRIKGVAGFGVSESNIKGGKSLDSHDIMIDIIRTGKTEVITGWDERFDREIFEAEGHADWVRIFTPITLRQENIGMVEAGFNRKIRAAIQNILVSIQPTIQEYQLRLLQAFINQVALALDNAHRYQASQRAAQREALIKDITTKVRASTNLEDILQTTIKEISQVISSKRAYIHLVTPPGVVPPPPSEGGLRGVDPAETNGKSERRAG